MPTARGKAAALGKISSMFQDVGRSATDIFKQRAAEKRRIAEEEKEKPFDELRKRLLSSQVESAELGTQQRQSDIESDKEIEDFMNSIGASDEEKQMAKTSTMKSNELLNHLKSAKENPQETIQEYAEFLRPDTEIGKQVRASLNPGQVAALDAILGQEQPEDAVKRMAPIVDEDTEIGKQARVTEAFDPTEPGAFDEKPLQPGERAPVKPQTSTFRFDDKTEEPEKVTRARKIVRELEGKRPTEKQKSLVIRNQAIIDKFEGRQEKLGDIESERDFQKSQATQAFKQSKSLKDIDFDNRKTLEKMKQNFQKTQNLTKAKNKEEKPLSGDASKIVGLITTGAQGVKEIVSKLRQKDLDFFGTTKLVGAFKNPEAKLAIDQAAEALGRLNSGGAINPDELKTFKNLIVDKKLMATEKGRKAILDNLVRFYSRAIQTGIDITGDENFESSRVTNPTKTTLSEKVETGGTPTISSDEEYNKLSSGTTFRDPDGNLRRKP